MTPLKQCAAAPWTRIIFIGARNQHFKYLENLYKILPADNYSFISPIYSFSFPNRADRVPSTCLRSASDKCNPRLRYEVRIIAKTKLLLRQQPISIMNSPPKLWASSFFNSVPMLYPQTIETFLAPNNLRLSVTVGHWILATSFFWYCWFSPTAIFMTREKNLTLRNTSLILKA